MINIRGEVVPLLDTGVLTGTGALADPEFAVLVSGATDMLAITAEALPEPAGFDEPVGPRIHAGERGVYSHDARLIMLVEIEELAKSRLESKRAS